MDFFSFFLFFCSSGQQAHHNTTQHNTCHASGLLSVVCRLLPRPVACSRARRRTSEVMSVFTPFLLLWCYLFYISGASSDNGMPRINFCVGLTTIPPRFSSVHHVVRSWLQQDLPPAIIVIFIPKKYTMFVNGIGRNKNKNFVTLTNELQSHFATEMDEGRVVLQLVSKDLGPLTKYIGMLEYFAAFDDSALGSIDRWVIGDDDVHYAAETLSGYANAISNHVPPSSVNEYVMTHFQVHTRVEILLDGDENIRHPIAHLQVLCRS